MRYAALNASPIPSISFKNESVRFQMCPLGGASHRVRNVLENSGAPVPFLILFLRRIYVIPYPRR